MTQKRHRLTQADIVRLGNWLEDSAERLQQERPTLEEAALEASDDLDLEVSARQIRRLREQLGITWPKSERESVDVRAMVLEVAREVADVKSALELDISPVLKRMLQH